MTNCLIFQISILSIAQCLPEAVLQSSRTCKKVTNHMTITTFRLHIASDGLDTPHTYINMNSW